MSKSRKSKTKIHTPLHRITSEPLRPQMRGALAPLRRMPGVLGRDVFTSRRSFFSDLRAIEDLRHDEPRPNSSKIHSQRYHRDDGTLAGFGPRPVRSRVLPMRIQMRVSFHQPERTVVCHRRQTRRRVLFALQASGRGRKSPRVFRKARWTIKSHIRCK